MSFFDARSFSEPKLSMEHFKEWAGSIANSYLSQGIEPTVSLVKIAQVEDLTPDQIKLLAGEANKLIHTQKYASEPADNKYHAAGFPLADAQKALTSLQVDGEVKVATTVPEPKFSDGGPDPYAMFGVEPEGVDKTASVKRELKVRHEKAALLKQKLGDEGLLLSKAAFDAERAFIKEARQLALGGASQLERLSLLGTAYTFAKAAGMADLARAPLAKLASVLGGEGLLEKGQVARAVAFFGDEKVADEKAPPELISGFLPAKVVNGDHPLYITLKTYHDRKSALELNRERYQVIDDRLKLMGQKIREL